MEKTMKARVQHKHDIEANWLKATNFTPLASEIIVYDPDENYDYPRIKIGDGKTNINSLPFVTKDYAKISDIPTKPEDIGALPNSTVIPTVPTKISAFENDKGYLTQHQSLDAYAKTADLGALATKDSLTASDVGALPDTTKIPSALSDLTEDSTHRTVTDTEKNAWNAKSNFSGNYADLNGKPAIPTVPTKISAFENDAGYLTEHQSLEGLATEEWVEEKFEEHSGFVAQPEAPEDTSVLWLDTDDDSADSGGNVDLTGVVKSVNGQKPDENGNVEISVSGGNTTQKEEVTTVSVGSESVTLDESAPEQVVNLAWTVEGARTIPAFTNYYIAKDNISYPRTFDTSGYTQFWSSNNFHGTPEAHVPGHQYFQAFHYVMDGGSTAEINSTTGSVNYITPTANPVISGSGWVYMLGTPTNSGAIVLNLNKTSTGTGTIDYVYCIDVTALQESGVITATTVNELAELFGELPLIPGQNYAGGSVGTGTATLSINRDGETSTVDNTSNTVTVKGGDILSVVGGSVTFMLKVIRVVSDESTSVWAGKKWVAFGDSLTDESINADKKYYRYIEEKTGITVVVMGRGGTGYYRTYDGGTAYGQRMAQVPADADVITIFGSVNDWHTKSANVAMGNASDTMEAGTLAGYINECIDVAIEKAPYAQIALVTPMDYKGLPSDTLEGIANIIKAVASYRQIKCLDMYHESGFRVRNPVFAQQFTTDYSETGESYGHPNNLAHEKLIAPEFMELLKRMILTA